MVEEQEAIHVTVSKDTANNNPEKNITMTELQTLAKDPNRGMMVQVATAL